MATRRRLRGIEAVTQYLSEHGVAYEVIEHAPTYSAGDEAAVTGAPAAEVAKTLLLRDGDGYRVAVIPGARRLDFARLRRALGGSHYLRLATEEEIEHDFPDFEVGALPPLATLLPAPEVVDVHVLEHERVICGGGDHRHSVRLGVRDLLRLTEPCIADICRPLFGRHGRDS
jgi:Ala-tRNA(Pro) deacylase